MQPVLVVLKGETMLTSPLARVLGAVVVASLVAASTALASGPPAGRWCAEVIRVNTQFGLMKNKTYVSSRQFSQKAFVAEIEYTLKHRAQFLAITPNEIRTAQTHQLAFFARLKANHYARTAPLGPFTLGDNDKLMAFQKTKCGIRFPTS
jgi:hypothetical protein